MFVSAEACLSSRERREQILNPVSVNRQVSQSPTVNTQGGLHLFSITGAGSFIPAICLLLALVYLGYMACRRCLLCQRQSMGRDAWRVMHKEGTWIPSSKESSPTASPSLTLSPPPRKRRSSPERFRVERHNIPDRFMDRPVPRTLDSPEDTRRTWRHSLQERQDRRTWEQEQARQQVAQHFHLHFAGTQGAQGQAQHQQASPTLKVQEVREF